MRKTDFNHNAWLVLAVLSVSLASCSETDEVEGDDTSRYRLSTEFLGNTQVLGVENDANADNDSGFSFIFQPVRNDIEVSGVILTPRNQEWIISRVDDRYYRISNRMVGTSLSLDIVNDGVFDRLKLAPSETRSGQEWQLTPLEDGRCRLTTEFLGAETSLDVTSDTTPPMLTMRTNGNFSGQKWVLKQLGSGDSNLDNLCPGPTGS
ncbi:MAG: RICIN domain-containing protein [Granulosicoccus sp.]